MGKVWGNKKKKKKKKWLEEARNGFLRRYVGESGEHCRHESVGDWRNCSWGNCNSKYGDPSFFCFEVGFCQGLCSGPGFGQSGAVPVSPAPGATERKKMRNRR